MPLTTLDEVRKRAELDAKNRNYLLNPDPEWLGRLLEGLKLNEEKYGYPSCPCRLSSGVFDLDRDIICPCDYRDPDIQEYGQCYCCLYVDEKVHKTGVIEQIPERRPKEKFERAMGLAVEREEETMEEEIGRTRVTDRKLMYCKVCGYTVFREEPPYVCPICQAKKEMFAEVVLMIKMGTS